MRKYCTEKQTAPSSRNFADRLRGQEIGETCPQIYPLGVAGSGTTNNQHNDTRGLSCLLYPNPDAIPLGISVRFT
uniref:Kringle domain-containing protein n=1 Tax=Ascaris lumbricoides TaxID=6252 RepID=A0A0M3HNE2_ASCLU